MTLRFRLPCLRKTRCFRSGRAARAVGARDSLRRIVLWFVATGVAFTLDRPVDPALAQSALVVWQGRVSTLYLERTDAPDPNRWQRVGGSAKRGVSHAAPAEVGPRLPFALTCFLRELDSAGFCRTTFTPTLGAPVAERLSGGLTGGSATEVSEIKWEFLGREGDADLYRITRRFPADAPQSEESVAKKVKFQGRRVVVFRDKYHVVVLDPIDAAGKQ